MFKGMSSKMAVISVFHIRSLMLNGDDRTGRTSIIKW